MSKRNKRIRAETDQGASQGRLKSGASRARLDDLLRFSFKFYVLSHPVFHCRDRGTEYFVSFLERIKSLSMEPLSALTTAKANATTRFHRIDWTDGRVSQPGFGVRGWEEYDQDAWQFSISSNEHGRVHGFLIGNVFYVVWLDPDHQLYPGMKT